MMDCFYDALFIRVDTDETVSFNEYADWTDRDQAELERRRGIEQ